MVTTDPAFAAAAMQDGWNINMYFQPPNSPDTNILDLGFFCAIHQSLIFEMPLSNTQELIEPVMQAFNNFDSAARLNHVFCP
jgi:hypothetical protein